MKPDIPPRALGSAPRPRRTQLERRQEAEERILEAAMVRVAARGTAMMSLADVGEMAGYSATLPAHHFGNKSGLLRQLSFYLNDRFRKVFVRGPKPTEGLTAVIRRIEVYLQAALEESLQFQAMQVLVAESATIAAQDLRQSVIEANRVGVTFFADQIEAGIRRGEIDPSVRPRERAIVILGTLRGLLSQHFLAPERFDLKAASTEFRRAVEVSLRPRGDRRDAGSGEA